MTWSHSCTSCCTPQSTICHPAFGTDPKDFLASVSPASWPIHLQLTHEWRALLVVSCSTTRVLVWLNAISEIDVGGMRAEVWWLYWQKQLWSQKICASLPRYQDWEERLTGERQKTMRW